MLGFSLHFPKCCFSGWIDSLPPGLGHLLARQACLGPVTPLSSLATFLSTARGSEVRDCCNQSQPPRSEAEAEAAALGFSLNPVREQGWAQPGSLGSVPREKKLEDIAESAFCIFLSKRKFEKTGQKTPKTERKERRGEIEIKTWKGGDFPGPTGPELPKVHPLQSPKSLTSSWTLQTGSR